MLTPYDSPQCPALGTTIYFCEPKYAVVPWIAEFWNTVSNAGYLLAAWAAPAPTPCLQRARAGLMAVGIGSSLLHALAEPWAQLLDEMSMLFLVLCLLRCAWRRSIVVEGAAGLCTLLYLGTGVHAVFVSTFFLLCLVLACACWTVIDGACLGCLAGAFAFWVAEQQGCAQYPILAWGHVAWHLGSAAACYLFLHRCRHRMSSRG
jgi:hypothetical protein